MRQWRGFRTERIIGLLRDAEVSLGQGQAKGTVCRGIDVSQQSSLRWRRAKGVLKLDRARATEKAVSELTHDKLILKEALDGKILSLPAAGVS